MPRMVAPSLDVQWDHVEVRMLLTALDHAAVAMMRSGLLTVSVAIRLPVVAVSFALPTQNPRGKMRMAAAAWLATSVRTAIRYLFQRLANASR